MSPSREEIEIRDAELNERITQQMMSCLDATTKEPFAVWLRMAGQKMVLEDHLYGKINHQAGMACVMVTKMAASRGIMDGKEAADFLKQGEVDGKAFIQNGDTKPYRTDPGWENFDPRTEPMMGDG